MKTTMLKLTLIALVSVSLFASCKKEEDKPTGCLINTANIAGSYKLGGMEYAAGGNVPPIDFMTFIDDCEKDDLLIFVNNGILRHEDKGTRCEESDNEEGTWKLEGNSLRLDGESVGAITSFDCKTMVYAVDNFLKQGDKMTITYIKQ